MARNGKVSTTWYDPETDDEWTVSATYNFPRAGSYYDPPEGGDFEDLYFTHEDEELDEQDFLERFGQKELDRAIEHLVGSIEDAFDDEDPPDRLEDLAEPDYSDIDDVLEGE